MLVANVIFHAFQAAYMSWVFLLPLTLLVVLAEAMILWGFNRGASPWALLACALEMNIASWFVGFWFSPMLFIDSGFVVVHPDEHDIGILEPDPDWLRLAQYSFLQAGILSAVVEAAILWPFRKLAHLRRVMVPVVLGNLISYVMLFLGFTAMFGG